MCGIFGKLSLHLSTQVGETVENAIESLNHRGPDDYDTWEGEGIFLGVRRLSIIDLSMGHQPIWNEEKTCCIIYNGELYNYLDLYPDLEAKGHVFRTRSDTEVILHAYEEWGPDCLRRFNGMFAFAVWDDHNRTLFLGRDRLGEKPLYYYLGNDCLIFASEIKAILSDNSIRRQLNLHGLANYLAFGHAVAPETIYQNIYKILPGHYLFLKDGHIKNVQFWDVGDEPELENGAVLTEDEYADRILSLLDDSVRRRMIADVPVGAFLSGGVDSGAVVALMKRHVTDPIKTFSLGFNIGGAYNELDDSRRLAKYLGTDHHEIQIGHVDLIQILRKLVYHYDEPFGDAAGFPLYLLSRFARESVKVVLAGDGGDELFGGYRRYAADQLASFYQSLPSMVTKSWIPMLLQRFPRLRRSKRLVQTLPIKHPASRYAAWLVLFTPEMQAELLRPEIFENLGNYDPAWAYPQYYAGLKSSIPTDHLNRLMYVDLKTWLADVYLEKVDKTTMSCGLEARLPLLDHRLVELAFQIPGHYKIKNWTTKRIFKRAIASLLPPEVLNKSKHGFSVPTDPWFRGDLKSFTFDILLDERARHRKYFNVPMVERLWREHVEGRHVWDSHLWLLLNFELWHRVYLDNEGI